MVTFGATDSDMEFRTVSGLESLRQRIVQHLRFARGESFFDSRLGVPYLAELLVRPASESLAAQVISSAITSVAGVRAVTNVQIRLDKARRILHYSANVTSDLGDQAIAGTI